jgi:hypothetical protein
MLHESNLRSAQMKCFRWTDLFPVDMITNYIFSLDDEYLILCFGMVASTLTELSTMTMTFTNHV